MKVALATVGTRGDVEPFAALARVLVARGHEVVAVSWPVHRRVLTIPGVRFVAAGPHADETAIARTAAEASAEGNPIRQVAILRDFHLVDGAGHYRQLREALAGHDLVVVHGIDALAHAAVLDLDARWASAAFDPVLLPSGRFPPPGMPPLGPLNRAGWWLVDQMLARLNGPLDEALANGGSSQRGLPLFRARSPWLHLVGCSPHVARVPDDLPPATRVTGAWFTPGPADPLPEALSAFLADGAPPVALTFGSMAGSDADALEEAVDRIVTGGARVVIQGRPAPAAAPGRVHVAGQVDHRALFPRVGLVVHHGGAGTTHAACAAGVPSVVVPHIGDQPYWADRLHRLGVAPRPLPARRLDGARLAATVLATLHDGGLRERAGALASRLRSEDGVRRAAELLESSFG